MYLRCSNTAKSLPEQRNNYFKLRTIFKAAYFILLPQLKVKEIFNIFKIKCGVIILNKLFI